MTEPTAPRSMNSEGSIRRARDAIVARYRRLERSVLVGVSGIDASGKSTLAAALRDELASAISGRVHLLPGDAFLNERSLRRDPALGDLAYFVQGFDYDPVRLRVCEPLVAGACVEATLACRDLLTDTLQSRRVVVGRGDILIIEGVFLFSARWSLPFDYRIWLEVSFDEALARASARPRDLEHYGTIEALIDRYRQLFASQRHHIAAEAPHLSADLRIET